MPNITMSRLLTIGRCRRDLLNNGVDLNALPRVRLRTMVRTDLEYFQLMLGDESSPRQIISLIKWEAEMSGVASEAARTMRRCAANARRAREAADPCPLVGEGHSRSVRGGAPALLG